MKSARDEEDLYKCAAPHALPAYHGKCFLCSNISYAKYLVDMKGPLLRMKLVRRREY